MDGAGAGGPTFTWPVSIHGFTNDEFSSTLLSDPFALAGPPLMAKTKFRMVIVTAPDLKTARKLARAALKARLIACANLIPNLESHYRWQGRLEQSAEVLLILKTSMTQLEALEKLVLAKHPYDTPEFVVMNPTAGARKYLAWWAQCLQTG
jgi:periplasmic divalent cation tolerance protein